ncbi:TerB family tellurite resistance protein [Sulfurospirillum sp. 1612]|uniref:TerB family tellurite resistance protein n=1 Tax=Sulfurospirillum sp. 1612 TaxID=3094835 RepID=UPI002F93DBD2
MKFILFVIVAGIFYLLTRNYKSDGYNIHVNTKQKFEGNLQDHEAGLIVAMMAKVAKADGRVCELEAELLSNTFTQLSSVFENQSEIREKLKDIYKEELKSFANTLEISQKYFKLTKNDYNKRYATLEYLLNLAFIDNEFTNEEYMICEDIAQTLEINKADFEKLVAKFREFYASRYNQQVDSLKQAYAIIGANENDDMPTIKTKYKKLVRANHPDLLMGKGAEQSIIDQATQKLQEINEAYEIIKKARA